LSSGAAALDPRMLADCAIRVLATRALEARGAAEAAARIRMLPPVAGADVARSTMPALERIARTTQAPPDLVRAAAQCAGAVIQLELPGGEAAGAAQLLAAVVRLATAAVRSGVSPAEVAAILAG
jgi:hypothetical protein